MYEKRAPLANHSSQFQLHAHEVPVDLPLSLPMFLRLYLIDRSVLLHRRHFTDASNRRLAFALLCLKMLLQHRSSESRHLRRRLLVEELNDAFAWHNSSSLYVHLLGDCQLDTALLRTISFDRLHRR